MIWKRTLATRTLQIPTRHFRLPGGYAIQFQITTVGAIYVGYWMLQDCITGRVTCLTVCTACLLAVRLHAICRHLSGCWPRDSFGIYPSQQVHSLPTMPLCFSAWLMRQGRIRVRICQSVTIYVTNDGMDVYLFEILGLY
ncbi:hypothetical protein F5Y17DRAFT_324474 [Xylariaceae sp. FL0594]|nr:hypothetical protein F5Y17DRAFT_324474 [Xylariaceae sp. FL0594]